MTGPYRVEAGPVGGQYYTGKWKKELAAATRSANHWRLKGYPNVVVVDADGTEVDLDREARIRYNG